MPSTVAAIGFSHFAVRGNEFQLSDFFGHFNKAFLFKLFLEVCPILTGAVTLGECPHHIHNRKPPLPVVQRAADVGVFKNDDFVGGGHWIILLKIFTSPYWTLYRIMLHLIIENTPYHRRRYFQNGNNCVLLQLARFKDIFQVFSNGGYLYAKQCRSTFTIPSGYPMHTS